MRRLVPGAAVAALLLAATGAGAAKPVCNLVPDKPDDANVARPETPVRAPAYDIRSIDVATGKKTLAVVMRLGSMDVAKDAAASGGMTYTVSFRISGSSHTFTRKVDKDGKVVGDTATADNTAIAGLVVKADAKSVTWTVPRGNVARLKAKNAMITGIFGSTTSTVALAYDYAPDNSVPSSVTYRDKTPSCVKPA